MKRSPELEALSHDDDPIIADRSVRRKQLAGGAALVLLGLVAGYLVLAGRQPPVRNMLAGDEEFTTTTFRPPSFMREGEPEPEAPAPEVIEIPPPPPPPPPDEQVDTTEFDVPPPPVPASVPPPPEPAEAPVEAFPSRLRSNMVVLDNPGSTGPGSRAGAEGEGLTVAGEDRSSKFLAAAASIGDRRANAKQIERTDALIAEGTLIPGILETAIVSDLPGQVRAIVSQDVHSFDGRRVLIPTGTRLIGEYQSEITRGQKRVFVVWTRMLRDDGVSVRLNSIGADSLGRAGLTGYVDNKFRERFGAAILLSVVGAGASYLTGYGSEAAAGDSDDAQQAEELARQAIAETFSDMANQALGRLPEDSAYDRCEPGRAHLRVCSSGPRLFGFVRGSRHRSPEGNPP